MLRLFPGIARTFASQKKPIRVAVTGAAGNIGYALLFRIANGDVLGYDQPVHLNLIEIPQMQNALKGVKMELGDCAFPLLRSISTTDNLNEGFKDVECAFFVGSKPRGKGQERGDLLKQNAAIFAVQGQALAKNASKNVKSLVVGNPANTNALILSTHAKGIPKENFCAMTRLDHDRALWQLSEKTNTPVTDIEKLIIWGNHSPTMFPDLTWTTINGKPANSVLDADWVNNTFSTNVKLRGQHIIEARGSSSAASAANAAINHMKSWFQGHKGWISFGVDSTGNQYGVPDGIFYSFPVEVSNGKWSIVKGLQLNAQQKEAMKKTADELVEERAAIQDMLK